MNYFSLDSRDPQWTMTQALINAGADTEIPGWVTQNEVLVQITPLELIHSWISKFGAKLELVQLRNSLREKNYAKLTIKGN